MATLQLIYDDFEKKNFWIKIKEILGNECHCNSVIAAVLGISEEEYKEILLSLGARKRVILGHPEFSFTNEHAVQNALSKLNEMFQDRFENLTEMDVSSVATANYFEWIPNAKTGQEWLTELGYDWSEKVAENVKTHYAKNIFKEEDIEVMITRLISNGNLQKK